jgi:predicted nucleic acid-binding protein
VPRLLVSDTSVLIDLERGGVLEAFFKLPYEIAVPDVLFDKELQNATGETLKDLGLQVLQSDEIGTALAQAYRKRQPNLSAPDAFSLVVAKQGGHILLAGDGSLRDLAADEGVEVHGTLWVFDELHRGEILQPEQLSQALEVVSQNKRCRLPKAEIQKRLKLYKENA